MLGSNSICHASHIRIIQPEIESVQPPLEAVPRRTGWFLFFFLACNLFHINYALPTKAALCQVVICLSLRDILTVLLLRLCLQVPIHSKVSNRCNLSPALHVSSLLGHKFSPKSFPLIIGHPIFFLASLCMSSSRYSTLGDQPSAHEHSLVDIRSSPHAGEAHLQGVTRRGRGLLAPGGCWEWSWPSSSRVSCALHTPVLWLALLRRDRSSLHWQASPTPLSLSLHCHGNVSTSNEKRSIIYYWMNSPGQIPYHFTPRITTWKREETFYT